VERQICIHALAAEAAEKAHFGDDAYEVDASKSVRAHFLVILTDTSAYASFNWRMLTYADAHLLVTLSSFACHSARKTIGSNKRPLFTFAFRSHQQQPVTKVF
jgi:hypothetical protein